MLVVRKYKVVREGLKAHFKVLVTVFIAILDLYAIEHSHADKD